MCTLPEKETISRKLLRISMLRLAKHLSMTERQIHLTPEVEGMVKELASEVDDVFPVILQLFAWGMILLIWILFNFARSILGKIHEQNEDFFKL